MTSLGNETPEGTYIENANFWVKIIRERLDRYRSELTDKAVVDAVGPAEDLTILDAGCGEGYLSRIFAQHGAQVIGVDACADLIESARTTARELGLTIDYHTRSVSSLPIPDADCDKIVCNHLINDLKDISKPFLEFARVLRQGGQLVILMLHPCFYSTHNERAVAQHYFGVRTVQHEFKVAGITSPARVTMWFRPLEDYTSQLRESGFFVTSLTEPHPSANQLASDPWWRENFTRPLFMLIVAEKTGKRP